jgi:methylmalonyl-CoA mutase
VTSPVVPLSEGFAPAAEADWLALVAKTLKGAGPESLVTRTADDLAIRPLYTAADGGADLPILPAPRDGERGWDPRAQVSAPELGLANTQCLDALAGGAASILLKINTGEGGGAPVGSHEDLARVLDGVMIDLAPVALDAGFLGPVVAGWLGQAAKAAPAAPIAAHLDPLSAFAVAGVSPGPVEAHVAAAAEVGARLAATYPKASLFLASGVAAHEAGGSPAWEIAFAAAAAVAYAKALTAAGLTILDALSRITLGLAVDAQPLGGIAKLRAARVVWTRISQACGAATAARIETRSSGRMLTRADRWTNLVRLTSAGFAAAVGGADAIVLGAFTDALDAPDAFALRMARNTQLILMEEAHLGRVADPAAGSWAMEAQTADLAQAAWTAFVAIEAAGGAVAALRDGLIAQAVGRSREALRTAVAAHDFHILGVTDFVADEPPPASAGPAPTASTPASRTTGPDPRQPGADSLCPALSPIRLEEMAR